MKYYKCIQLKNGTDCILRNPDAKDAEMILRHMIQTSGETENMARYPDEITMTTEQEAEFLKSIESSPNAIMISAVIDGKIIANAGLHPINSFEKYKHRVGFGISIQKAYWGMGIGSAILSAIIESARLAGYEQIELDVVTSNDRAIALYKGFGFQIYGTHENAFRCRDGHYESLFLMLLRL
ncbi:GNAT family N-acetyltransferase [Acetanaerobacterium elongatum]|uniref:Protein N-acetyltransferase, RimJ/RimL family n=1 Tax=Acetanaerobacterium elongatum TaxID=258515 RepID=A0A1G9UQ65_9FIRM|nr:GNAT family N-acetyltransferase [Acetanaerobacterium elongatum]SDM61977.1 Protein N-acetyltransferase, RimJ/RimL family [Acetanaerobacterium elongatum]